MDGVNENKVIKTAGGRFALLVQSQQGYQLEGGWYFSTANLQYLNKVSNSFFSSFFTLVGSGKMPTFQAISLTPLSSLWHAYQLKEIKLTSYWHYWGCVRSQWVLRDLWEQNKGLKDLKSVSSNPLNGWRFTIWCDLSRQLKLESQNTSFPKQYTLEE